MYTIVQCENLQIMWPDTKELAVQSVVGFSSIRTNHVITECVAVLDGYHMELTSVVPTRHMVSTYKLRVTTTVISSLLGWVGLV